MQSAIVSLPNFPAEIVPEGKTAEDNLVVKLVESYTALPENPLPHWELARKYDIIDFDLGVKLTGAGFPLSLIHIYFTGSVAYSYTPSRVIAFGIDLNF